LFKSLSVMLYYYNNYNGLALKTLSYVQYIARRPLEISPCIAITNGLHPHFFHFKVHKEKRDIKDILSQQQCLLNK
jgi:hypothetical protein